LRSGPTDRPRSGLLPAPRSSQSSRDLGRGAAFRAIAAPTTQMALDRRRPDPEGTADYQPGVLKPSINVDNLRWKMIGVCLHQPPPRPKPARIAHLACLAARTTWARRADLVSAGLAFHEAGLSSLTPDGVRLAREWDLCSLYARRDRRWYLKVRANPRPEGAAVSHSESGAPVRQDRSAPATPDRARILWRRYPLHRSHQWEGLLATLLSPATGLLRYAVAAYRQCFISGRGSIWNSHKHRTI
jgi:hypothetical protein